MRLAHLPGLFRVNDRCPVYAQLGRHDWRVDPTQVVVMIGDQARVRVCCATCYSHTTLQAARRFRVDPNDVKTWRPYVDGP